MGTLSLLVPLIIQLLFGRRLLPCVAWAPASYSCRRVRTASLGELQRTWLSIIFRAYSRPLQAMYPYPSIARQGDPEDALPAWRSQPL